MNHFEKYLIESLAYSFEEDSDNFSSEDFPDDEPLFNKRKFKRAEEILLTMGPPPTSTDSLDIETRDFAFLINPKFENYKCIERNFDYWKIPYEETYFFVTQIYYIQSPDGKEYIWIWTQFQNYGYFDLLYCLTNNTFRHRDDPRVKTFRDIEKYIEDFKGTLKEVVINIIKAFKPKISLD